MVFKPQQAVHAVPMAPVFFKIDHFEEVQTLVPDLDALVLASAHQVRFISHPNQVIDRVIVGWNG